MVVVLYYEKDEINELSHDLVNLIERDLKGCMCEIIDGFSTNYFFRLGSDDDIYTVEVNIKKEKNIINLEGENNE